MSWLVIPYTSFGEGPEKCPREPLVFFFTPQPHPNILYTFFLLCLLPLPTSFTLIALARNTALCFSWQNSAGCPCVPEKPAFSPSSLQPTRTFLTFSACSLWTVHFQPPHIIQAPKHCRTGWDRYILSLTLHPHSPCLSSSVSKVSQ